MTYNVRSTAPESPVNIKNIEVKANQGYKAFNKISNCNCNELFDIIQHILEELRDIKTNTDNLKDKIDVLNRIHLQCTNEYEGVRKEHDTTSRALCKKIINKNLPGHISKITANEDNASLYADSLGEVSVINEITQNKFKELKDRQKQIVKGIEGLLCLCDDKTIPNAATRLIITNRLKSLIKKGASNESSINSRGSFIPSKSYKLSQFKS